MRLTGILLAAIAIASLAVGASGSYAQPARQNDAVSSPRPDTRRAMPRRRPAPDPAADKKTAAPDKLSRTEFSLADEAVAKGPCMAADVRFWGDSVADFQHALPPEPGAWLILSTGGEEGAYGAGFLNGWAATGTRPQFSVITGVSTGALMATYVFAGGKYDEELHQV